MLCTQEDLNHRGGEIMIFIVMYVCMYIGRREREGMLVLVDEYMYDNNNNNRLISVGPT